MRSLILGLLLALAFPAQAEIYNGTTIQGGGWNLTAPYLKPHREIKMRELWDSATADNLVDYSTIDTAWVTSFVAALPNTMTYEFDLEGTATPNQGREDWWYDGSPATSVILRRNMMQTIRDANPNINIGIYGIPDYKGVRESRKAPGDAAAAQSMAGRMANYKLVTDIVDTLYVTAYWNEGPNDIDKLPEWRAEVDMRIALARLYTGKLPRVYVWHRGFNIVAPDEVAPEIFYEMLSYLSRKCVDIVFWAESGDAEFEDWVKFALERHATAGICIDPDCFE